MASIHKRTGSKFWSASYTDAGGKRRLRSTGETRKKAASEIASGWEAEARKARGFAESEGQHRMAELVAEARRLASVGKLSVSVARQLMAEVLDIGTDGESQERSVAAWLAEWVAEKRDHVEPKTHRQYQHCIGAFLSTLDDPEMPLEMLGDRQVREFRDKERAAGGKVKAATVNQKISYLRAALGDAVKRGHCNRNVAAIVDHLKETDSGTRLPFTMGEAKDMVNATEGTDWEIMILLGVYTGARLMDCARLRWRNVDLVKGEISFRQDKTGNPVRVPIHDRLMTCFIGREAGDDPDAFVMPKLATKATSTLSSYFTRNVLPDAQVPKEARDGDIVSSRSFHCLRHTLTTELANRGIPSEVRQRITGHESAKVHKRYTHIELGTMREALANIPKV